MNNLYRDMLSKGLISVSKYWLDRAVEERATNCTVALAWSVLSDLDEIDKQLVTTPYWKNVGFYQVEVHKN